MTSLSLHTVDRNHLQMEEKLRALTVREKQSVIVVVKSSGDVENCFLPTEAGGGSIVFQKDTEGSGAHEKTKLRTDKPLSDISPEAYQSLVCSGSADLGPQS